MAIEVRASDVVSHEAPNPAKVRKMVAHLRRGGVLPPIEIDTAWRVHWTQGPREMEAIGTGFGLLDGHHTLAAHRVVHGSDSAIGAVYAARRLSSASGVDNEALERPIQKPRGP